MIHLVMLDDHALIRRGMRDVLGQEPGMTVAGEAATHDELRALLPGTPCDVLLLDINLNGPSGLQVLEAMRAEGGPVPRTLVVSMYPEDQYAVQSLRAGAWGYVNKAADSSVLVQAIRQVALGRKYISAEIAALLVERLAEPAQARAHERLSDREQQMLVMIASGHKLLDIAQQLGLTPKSVSVYRARLLEKMRLSTNAEIAHYAVTNGLVN